jgi:hypothetical protein
MLASWNLKGLVLLCLVCLCFASAGRFAPLMELQRTCSFVSYMVVFCSAVRYAHLLELERTCFVVSYMVVFC